MKSPETITDQFTLLVKKIVADEYPEELANYEVESADLVARLQAGQDIRTTRAPRLDFEFGESIAAVLKFVPLLWATYKVFKEAKAEFRQKEPATPDLRERWTRVLREAGVAEQTAHDVANKFHDELLEVLKSQ